MRFSYSHPRKKTEIFDKPVTSVLIGRNWPLKERVDIDLAPDEEVARPHARLTLENGEYWIEDLKTKTGTWVKGYRIKMKTQLELGDKVWIGRWVLEIEPGTDGKVFVAPSFDEELSQTQKRLRAFYELSQALGAMTPSGKLLEILAKKLREVIPLARRGAILELKEDGNLDLTDQYWPPGVAPSTSTTFVKRARSERRAFIWNGEDASDSVLHHKTQSALYAPMLWEGQVVGVLYVDNEQVMDAFATADLEWIQAIANQAALFIKNQEFKKEIQHQAEIRGNLLRQFPPKIAEAFARGERPQMGGKKVFPVTLLFSDVRKFTAKSHSIDDPEKVVKMLNDMFWKLTPIVHEYDGVVDKYIGDGMLAVFGSPDPDPDHLMKAIRAALKMQQTAMVELAQRWTAQELPEIFEIGIGIHTGEAVHGFVGAEKHLEYTVIGDDVNRTARYCDGAKSGQILISQEAFQKVHTRLIDPVEAWINVKSTDPKSTLQGWIVTQIKKS